MLREDVLPVFGRPKTEIARLLGISRRTLYDILEEKAAVTPAVALRLVQVTLAEAEADFVALAERASAGEEVVIVTNDIPVARLIPAEQPRAPRVPANICKVTYIADDFDELDPEIVELFEGRD